MNPTEPHRKPGFFNNVSLYGLEFAVAMITLIIGVSVLSFATFALCNYLAYDNVGSGRGYFALWSSASTIVWVPVAIIFYLRSRAYSNQKPEVTSNPVQHVFTVIYQIVMILTIISFAVAAVYAALMSLVKPDETTELLLSAALPSAISALLFGGALVSFFRRPVIRRRTFAVVFIIISTAIIVPTIIVSVMTLRALAIDEAKSQDLTAIKSAIDAYSDTNNKTPADLNAVRQFIDSDSTANKLGSYDYKRVDNTRYQLCANYSADSPYYRSSAISKEYDTYESFSQYKAGETCYKLRTTYNSAFDYGSSSRR